MRIAQAGRQLDFAQALARRGGWWIGNTGYGYGMDDAVSFTERVMHLFAQELTRQANMPVGEALQRAKQRYLGGAPSGGSAPTTKRLMIEATLYGLPMYRVSVPHLGAQAPVEAGGRQSSHPAPAQAAALSTVPVSITPTLQLVTATVGSRSRGQLLFGGRRSPGQPGPSRTATH